MGFIKYLLFLIMFITLFGCSSNNHKIDDDSKIVAKIGDDYIVTLKSLNKYITDWHFNRKYRVRSEIYNNALDELLLNQLKRFDFFERKLNEDQDLMKNISREISNELISTFFNKQFMGKYVNEKKAAEAYEDMDEEVKCLDILLHFSENSSKESLDSIKSLAFEIESDIKNNNDFEGVIKRYFKKYSLSSQMKKVTWSLSMNDPVASVAYKINVGETRVIQAYDGVHIVKTVEKRKIDLAPYEDIKDDIIKNLRTGNYSNYSEEYEEYRRLTINKGSMQWNEAALNQLIKWSEDQRFYAGAYKDTIQNNIKIGNNFEILSYDNVMIDLKEYLRLLEDVVILSPNLIISSINAKDFITEAVYDDNIVKAAKKLGLEEAIINPNTESSLIRDRLAYLYNLAVIEEEIPEATPEALKEFYEDQRDSVFYQLKKINIYTRIYSDSTKAAEEISKIKKGIPFEKISDRWFVKTFIRERDGSLKSFGSKEPPYLAEAGFKLKLNEADGPIAYYDSIKGMQYAVIKCINIRPEKQLTYEDVEGERIIEEFKNYYRQKISDEVEADLYKKYDVEIYKDVLSEVISAE